MAMDELAEHVAGQLLARWGVVFWDLASHEDLAVPWREILWACAGSRPGAWSGAGGSSMVSLASSTPCPRRWTSSATSGAVNARTSSCACRRPTR